MSQVSLIWSIAVLLPIWQTCAEFSAIVIWLWSYRTKGHGQTGCCKYISRDSETRISHVLKYFFLGGFHPLSLLLKYSPCKLVSQRRNQCHVCTFLSSLILNLFTFMLYWTTGMKQIEQIVHVLCSIAIIR